jgi:dTDP-4-amino-4,6-dideoxygalactose transaminase
MSLLSSSIPILNLKEQYEQIAPELENAVLKVLRSGNYILGENGARLEAEVASLCGCKHGIGVANGTDALSLALWSLDIKAGDEVITTPFTFAATVESIAMRGAKPVFVDADESTFNIDTKQIERAITAKTKAIMPVHLYGLPAEMDQIRRLAKNYSLQIIEDNAQAIGAKYKGLPTGSLSDLACISFYPTKNLGACGDAGMIVTNDDSLAERLRVLRAHGMRKRYYHDEVGVNSRLDEIQAAVLLAKLPYLAGWNLQRQQVAELYQAALADCPMITLPQIPGESELSPSLTAASDTPSDKATTHVWHQYTIKINTNESDAKPGTAFDTTRDTIMKLLAERGIGSMCYYPLPLHIQPAFSHYGYHLGDFPVAEKLARQVISLPMYPELNQEQINLVAASLKEVISNLNSFVGQATPVQAAFIS